MRTILALVFLASPVFGQDETNAKIGRLLEAMQVGQQMGQNLDNMSKIQSDAMRKALVSQLGQDKLPIIEDLVKRIFGRMRDELAWEKLKPEFIAIYARNFTPAEIDDMLKFYESPMGKTLIMKQFDLNQKAMKLGMDAVSDLMPGPPETGPPQPKKN